MVAEWGPRFTRRVIQAVFSAHSFCNAKCHPPFSTLLQCLTAIIINSWDICILTHPFMHCMLILWRFGSLPSESQVPDALLRFCSQGGFFHGFCGAFLLRCIVPPTCLCYSVCQPQRRAEAFEKLTGRSFPESSMSFCGCVVSTWKKNDSDPPCLPVHTSTVSWLLSGGRFSHAE